MPSDRTFVIVGASLAGAKAAETLRAQGFDGRVVLIGAEVDRPYERPALSKGYLRGEKNFRDIAVHDLSFYDAHSIELRTSTMVTELDVGLATVTLDSGERLGYDRLLLATGASPRRLSIPGSEVGGVHYLRTATDADALRQTVVPSSHVVVIGAGWIGSEFSASARQLGAEVALVERGSVPLERTLGSRVGGIYRDLHAAHGVDLHFGAAVESIEGSTTVEGVRLTDGTVLDADVVLVGVGVAPRIELAQDAGLALDNGIAVNEYLETNAPGIYAAGDVANAFHPFYGTHIRLEHWSAALNQGQAAAKNMLGIPTIYDKVPYFFSDQYDLGMEYRGWAPDWDEVVVRGNPADQKFIVFWLRDGSVIAAMNANIWDAGEVLEEMILRGDPVDPRLLGDFESDLSTVVSASTSG